MLDRAVPRERILVLAVVALLALVALTMAVAAVVVMQRSSEVMMVDATLAMGDYLSFSQELTTFVPVPRDSNLPAPSM